MRYLILFIFVVLFVVIPSSNATQDVEDPQDIILFIRTVMSEPIVAAEISKLCLLYTSPSPRDKRQSRMPSSA